MANKSTLLLCAAAVLLQTLAYRKILGGLAAGGLLKGDVEAMIEAEIGGIFMPHGEQAAVDILYWTPIRRPPFGCLAQLRKTATISKVACLADDSGRSGGIFMFHREHQQAPRPDR